jgi:hypothetical protein
LTFPATPTSSSMLQIAHLLILLPSVLVIESRSDQLQHEVDDTSKKNQ